MKLHLPSFMLGVSVGAGAVAIAPRLRPLALELATAGVRLADTIAVRIARTREDAEDLWAEAKARARALRPVRGNGAPAPKAAA